MVLAHKFAVWVQMAILHALLQIPDTFKDLALKIISALLEIPKSSMQKVAIILAVVYIKSKYQVQHNKS